MKASLEFINLKLIAFFLLSITCSTLYATLNPGSLMVIAFDADNWDGVSQTSPDHFAFVVLVDVPVNEVVYITDNEWNGSGWAGTSEGEISWTNDTGSSIAAGTVVTVQLAAGTGTLSVDVGSVSNAGDGGTLSLTTSGDELYFYQGTSATAIPDNFITAFSSDDDGTASIAGTGLTDGVNAIDDASFSGEPDVLLYSGSTNCGGGTAAACAAMIANTANWSSDNGASDESIDSNFPDIPSDVPGSFTPPLPIELLSFNLNRTENGILISWSTVTEINNDYMVVERSIDARSFEDLAKIEGAGSTLISQNYSFLDESPKEGINYYRLRQVDFDGKESTHNVKSINWENDELNVSFSPNPVHEKSRLTFSKSPNQAIQISIFNTHGQLKKEQEILEQQKSLEIEMSDLPAGIYFLKIHHPGNLKVVQFIKY